MRRAGREPERHGDTTDDPTERGPLDRDPSEGGAVPDAGPGAEHAESRPSVSSGDTANAVDDAARGTGLPDPDEDDASPAAPIVDPGAGEGLA